MILAVLGLLGVLMVFVGSLAVLAWRQQPHPGARSFAIMTAGVAWWIGAMATGHTLDQVFGLHTTFVFMTRVEWVGIFVMTIGWFVFALEYTGRSEYATRRIVAILAVFPLLTYPVAFTNGLFLDAIGSVLGLSLDFTASFDPWLLVEPLVLAYIYALLAASSLLLLSFVITSRLPHPEVAILWLLALVVPWSVNALYVTGTIPPLGPARFDPTPFGFVGLAGIGFVAIRRYDAFKVAPVARAYIVDQLDVGIVVCDRDYRIVDANEWACSIAGIDADRPGRDLRDVLESEFENLQIAEETSSTALVLTDQIDGQTVQIEMDGEIRDVSIETSTLERAYGNQVDAIDGYALVLRDVTTRIEREATLERQNEQLEVLNQVIRHDIRNDMQIVGGMSERLTDHVDDEGRAYLETIIEKVDYVVDLTRTVRNLTGTILDDDDDLRPVPLHPVLEEEVTEVESTFEAAEVTIEDGTDVSVRANDMLGSVFRNLLQNAVLHNDAATPEVTVSTDEKPDSVVVSVADNGPGIPPGKREEVFERGERGQASDGSGLGLYLVETLVDHAGGDVWVEGPESETEFGAQDDTSQYDSGGSVEGTVFCVELEKAS